MEVNHLDTGDEAHPEAGDLRMNGSRRVAVIVLTAEA